MVQIPFVPVEVFGEAPKYKNEVFVARVEFVGSDCLVHRVPFVEIAPEPRFQKTDCSCDHCGKDRTRKDVYIVHNTETGQQKQIGRTCLRDYLGIDNPEKIVGRFTFWSELAGGRGEDDDCLVGLADYGSFVSTKYLLSLAVADIRTDGWVSGAAAAQNEKLSSTASRVGRVIWPQRYKDGNLDREESEFREAMMEKVTEEDRATADAAIAYFSGLENPSSDYEHNLSVLLKAKTLPKRSHFALVVSGASAYLRHIEKLNTRQKMFEQKKNSVYVGTVGERMRDLELKLDQIINFGKSNFNRYQDSILQIFVDNDGNQFSWFTTSGTGKIGVGNTAKFDATVKEHREYNGIKQTILTRVKEKK